MVLERPPHHVHHSDHLGGGQGDVDGRPHPRPHGRGRRHRSRSSVSDSGTVRFGGQLWSAAWQASAYAARSPRRVPLPLLVLGGEDGERVLDLLAAGGLPADEPLVDPGDLHDRAAAGRHLPRFPRPPEPG